MSVKNHLAGFAMVAGGEGADGDAQIRLRHQSQGFVWPLHQLESRIGKHLTKTGVFPFLRIIEAIKIEVTGTHLRQVIDFHHRITRAFDGAHNTECTQQVPSESGFASAEFTMQSNDRIFQCA